MTAGAAIKKPARLASEIAIAGDEAVCDQGGALYFPALKLLAVSDLHLEKGSAFARRGMLMPPYDTAATLLALHAVIARYEPRIVVSLGDSFHDDWGSERLPAVFRERLLSLMAGRDWFWVAGNHDPKPPVDLPGTTVQELAAGNVRFRHEPSRGAEPGEVAGHLHPCARIVQRAKSVRRRCFATDGSRMIMPAFGAYTGSLNVLDRAFAGLFSQERLMAHMLGDSGIFPIARAMLRPG